MRTLGDMKSHISTPEQPAPVLHFARLLSATPRGAHTARLLTVRHLARWGWPAHSAVSESAALVVAELAANAVTHGRVRGRGFRLALTASMPDALHIEVSDPRGERRPQPRTAAQGAPAPEGGRGLLLVDALASGWGTRPYPPSGKTVWARLPLR